MADGLAQAADVRVGSFDFRHTTLVQNHSRPVVEIKKDIDDIDIFNSTGAVLKLINDGEATGRVLHLEGLDALSAARTDGYSAGILLDPSYDQAFTVTRHNYIDMETPTLTNGATVTDAAIMRFDAAAGTHLAVDSGSTKTTPSTVDAWLKVNINGTIYFVPAYTSKTT